jgi:hypothetical protein
MIQSIFKSGEAFAEAVKLQPLGEYIQSLAVQNEKITVAVIGRPFAQPQTALSVILGEDHARFAAYNQELTDVMTPIYYDAEGPSYKIWQEDGHAVLMDHDSFFEVLSGTYMRQMIKNQMGLPASLLKRMDVKLVIAEDTFQNMHWDSVFEGVDFAVLAINATMMFTEGERQFFKTKLLPRFGATGTVLAVNQMAMLREGDWPDVIETVDYYCPKEAGFIVCYDVPKLNEMMLDSIAEMYFTKNTNRVRLETMTRNANCCIAAVETHIAALRTENAQDQTKAREAIEKMRRDMRMLEKRNIAEIRRLEMFENGNVGVTLLNKIDTFNDLLKEELALGMSEATDYREVGRRAAPFIERAWQTFFKNQEVWLKRRVYEEMEAVSKRFEANMSELISGSEPEVTMLLKGFMSRRYNFNTIASEKIISDNTPASISKYLAIGGIALLFVNIPLAAITVGTSKLIKYKYREDIQYNQMMKLKMYLNKDCDALRDEMYHRAESQMHELVKTLSESAEALHNEMMQSLFNALNAQADRLKASDDTLTYVEQYEKETLPTLKEQLIG